MAETGFPSYLLERPTKEKLDYFDSYTIAHPILKEVYSKLIQAIKEPAGKAIIFVFGPTGAGKTTLRYRIEKQLKEDFLALPEKDLTRIPVVSMEAIAPDSGNFNWKDYYRRALTVLEEPLIKYKTINKSSSGIVNQENSFLILPKIAGTELRYSLENALRHRKPSAFLVDEAQHLAKIASGRKLQDQLDSIKSLVNTTNIIHVLIGTYELLPFRNLSAQLSRRSLDIHFRRYSTDSEDLKAFKNIIYLFQCHLPLSQEFDLLKYWEYCYERSTGCVGILKNWLMDTLASAFDNNESFITIKGLQQNAYSIEKCKQIAEEIIDGEMALSEKPEHLHKLQTLLGLQPLNLNTNKITEEKLLLDSKSTNKHKVRQVGKRNPKRDKVGE